MNPLDSLGRSIKNIFVGSHRGEDFILENLEKSDKKKSSMPKDTNNLGVNPVEWFENPLDSMPIAKDYEPPRPEEDVADWFGEEKPKECSMKVAVTIVAVSSGEIRNVLTFGALSTASTKSCTS